MGYSRSGKRAGRVSHIQNCGPSVFNSNYDDNLAQKPILLIQAPILLLIDGFGAPVLQ